MYSENSIISLNEEVKSVLKHYKCPLRVYKDIWLYMPHTKVPQMCKLYEELISNLANRILKKSNIRQDLLTQMNKYTGSSINTVLTIINMYESREYYNKMRKIKIEFKEGGHNVVNRLFVMGPYVKLRSQTKKMLYEKGINVKDLKKLKKL